MKRVISLLCAAVMLFSFGTVFADAGVSVYVNELRLEEGMSPFIENGRTMVPMRSIFSSLGATVTWHGTESKVTASKSGTDIVLQINNDTMLVNGSAKTLDAAPKIVSDTTFVPLRAVSQALGCEIVWFPVISRVYIDSPAAYKQDKSLALYIFTNHSTKSGYTTVKATSDEVLSQGEAVCLQGIVTDVTKHTNGAVLTVENYHLRQDVRAVLLSLPGGVSTEEISKIFSGNTVSFFGTHEGTLPDIGMPCISADYSMVFESGKNYYTSKLPYPEADSASSSNIYESAFPAPKPQAPSAPQQPQKVTMYAPDGRTIEIYESEIAAYQHVGWYTEPVTVMYAPDGRTMYSLKSQVEANKAVGWYTEPYTPPAQTAPSSSSAQRETNYGVYITRTGECYHFRSSCVKYPIPSTMSDALARGLRACSKCAK